MFYDKLSFLKHTCGNQAVKSVHFPKHFVYVTLRLELTCVVDNHVTFQQSHPIGHTAYIEHMLIVNVYLVIFSYCYHFSEVVTKALGIPSKQS